MTVYLNTNIISKIYNCKERVHEAKRVAIACVEAACKCLYNSNEPSEVGLKSGESPLSGGR